MILLILVGLGVGVYLVQKSGFQIFQSRASNTFGEPDILRNINSEKGFQIDTSQVVKIPPKDLYDTLQPHWIRFVYRPDKGIPTNTPSNVKRLLIFNNESAEPAPIGETGVSTWNKYIDKYYLPALDTLLRKNLKFDAIEIWNEEDVCPSKEFYCPGVPAQSYAYMVKKAAEKIKSYNGHIQVIIGGLNSGQVSYIQDMKKAEPNVLAQVDGVGLHPYGRSPDGWCAKNGLECGGIFLSYGDLAENIKEYRTAAGFLPIWVTEIGFGVDDQAWQANFLARSFKVLSDNNVAVIIWYAWSDKMLGGADEDNWGLVDKYSTIKAAGTEFELFIKK